MKRKIIETAMNEISDQYIENAAFPKKKRRLPWLGAVAAMLVLVLAAGILARPYLNGAGPASTTPTLSPGPASSSGSMIEPGSVGIHLDYSLASPDYPKQHPYPLDESDSEAYDLWQADWKALRNHPEDYVDNLHRYFSRFVPLLLTAEEGKNAVCSPLNIYMALAMLAEITAGDSRNQILELLNAESAEALRTQAEQVWKAHYHNDGLSTSILGSSLWLDQDYTCVEETAQILADHYFASVFTGDLGTEEMDEALQSWLNSQTGGLLKEYTQDIQMDLLTALALASTVYYQVQWTDEFHEEKNTEGMFHSPSGDTEVTFMNSTLMWGPYYWGESFGAVALGLEDGSTMWLFLPDEGVTPEALLSSGQIFDFLDAEEKNQKSIIVNLSLPKFDIAAKTDLTSQLQTLGVTDVFQSGIADFSPIIEEDDDGYVSEVTHAARVAIDEKGVTAAAFTLILRCGVSMPPEDEIDFVLDRPFLFVIESRDGLPLFAGTVYEP